MDNKNCYIILHLKSSATQEEIKRSYRTLAKVYHPDKPGGNADKFRVIKQAYDILMKATVKAPKESTATTPNYNNRTMAKPMFNYIKTVDEGDKFVLHVSIANCTQIRTNKTHHSWDLPHHLSYKTSMSTVRLNLSYASAKSLDYSFRILLVGIDGKEYESHEEFKIPKPKGKSRLSKLFNDIW